MTGKLWAGLVGVATLGGCAAEVAPVDAACETYCEVFQPRCNDKVGPAQRGDVDTCSSRCERAAPTSKCVDEYADLQNCKAEHDGQCSCVAVSYASCGCRAQESALARCLAAE